MNKATNNKTVCQACIDEVPSLCHMAREAAHALWMDENSLCKLEVSVDEACTNIACYSYQGNPDGKIWLTCECHDGNFIVTIEDTGVAFDQTQPMYPDFESDIRCRKRGGLGRYIMQNFLDELSYERKNGRNVLTLVKKLES